MPFPESIRNWWAQVSDNKCQVEIYDEKRGFHKCGAKLKHIHHIDPEGEVIARGENPDYVTGMGLCEDHHVRNTGEEEYSENFAFHPEMGEAYKSYREWKANKLHLESIVGHKLTREEYPSPFDDAVEQHREATKRGETYVNGDSGMAYHYTEEMEQKALDYVRKTGEKKPSATRREKKFGHPKTNWEWSKDLFDDTDTF